ncbi:DUF3800 domain-containing protein [Arthrobacter sp. MI7-26]|uniref:DUF3800 domain-containing protein n=1 Tax=Arthrobacter sp. MI7-26 TaxID=2993653 RepID=UPI0022489237|nr:DUF3800 domain-containing protein [Arthrobacter sp. MI7-26]MCX2749184.1 DUF3800 domain-containing protein [Arthrobacter sp. MI7-26]
MTTPHMPRQPQNPTGVLDLGHEATQPDGFSNFDLPSIGSANDPCFPDESARGGQLYYMGALMVGAEEARKLEKSLDAIVAAVVNDVPGFDPATELHGYEVFHQKEGWEGVPVWLAVNVCKQVAEAIHDSGAVFVFRGIDVQKLKDKYANPHPAHALALSHTLESVQRVLNLDHTDESALVLADEHHTAPDSRTRFRGMRAAAQRGYTSIPLSDLIDTIYFGPSNHSRLLQAADMATFLTNRSVTIAERHPAAKKAMQEIKGNLDQATRFSYVWP